MLATEAEERILRANSLARHWARDWRALALERHTLHGGIPTDARNSEALDALEHLAENRDRADWARAREVTGSAAGSH